GAPFPRRPARPCRRASAPGVVRLPLRVSPAPVYGGGGTMRPPHAPITASRVSGASGGIGRRAGFRFLWSHRRRGSSPPSPAPRVVPSRHSRPHSFGPLRRGCRRPTTWCDAHHLISWWEHQGPTDFDNLILLCRYHLTLIHRRGCKPNRHRHPPHLHPTRRHDPSQRPTTNATPAVPLVGESLTCCGN